MLSPMNINHLLQQLVITAPPFLFALTVHEFSHGYVAYKLGDPTAARLGRLSLNPMKHLDPLGVLAFFLTKIGWAKPVPIDARYFRNPGRDMLLVALAGPGMNLALAVASTLSAKVIIFASAGLPAFLDFLVQPLLLMTVASIWINLMLAVFNLVPIPPLDGSRVLGSLLPPHMARSYARLEPYGFIIVLILFYTGILPRLIMPIVSFAQAIIMG